MRHELWAGVLGEEENTQRVEGCEGGGQVIGVTPGGRGSLSLGWGLAETLPAVGEGGVWTRFRLRRCSRHQHWPSTPDPPIPKSRIQQAPKTATMFRFVLVSL